MNTAHQEKMRSASRCDECRSYTWSGSMHRPVADEKGRWHHPACGAVVEHWAYSVTRGEVAHIFSRSPGGIFTTSICGKSKHYSIAILRNPEDVCFVCKTEAIKKGIKVRVA